MCTSLGTQPLYWKVVVINVTGGRTTLENQMKFMYQKHREGSKGTKVYISEFLTTFCSIDRGSGWPAISSVAQLCPTLHDHMDCSMPGFPVHHQLPELAQTHVHQVGNDIQPSHPLSSPFPPAFNLSQHQGLFQWVHSSHQVTKVLEFHLQHQSFQWIFRTDFL